LGQTTDRFREYNNAKIPDEKFQLAFDMKYPDGVEVLYMYEVPEDIDFKNKSLKKLDREFIS